MTIHVQVDEDANGERVFVVEYLTSAKTSVHLGELHQTTTRTRFIAELKELVTRAFQYGRGSVA